MRIGIKEEHRTSQTHIRLSTHFLAMQIGRWNRHGRGRLPVKEHLCAYGEIQTDKYVFEQCPASWDVR